VARERKALSGSPSLGCHAHPPSFPRRVRGCYGRRAVPPFRGTGKPLYHFDYAGPLTETVLLGKVSYRCGSEITWDAEKGLTEKKEANEFLGRPSRKGWE
jgi:hypothetical protein